MASLYRNYMRRLLDLRVGYNMFKINSSSSVSKSPASLINMESPSHMLPIWQRYKPDVLPVREQYMVVSELEQKKAPKWYPNENAILRITLKRYVFISNLKPVKQILISFDPFHEQSFSIRHFAHWVTNKHLVRTNDAAVIRVDVRSDRSDPLIQVLFMNGDRLIIETANMQTLDLVRLFHNETMRRFFEAQQVSAPSAHSAAASARAPHAKKK